jgi:hypothetical protein
MRRWESEVLQTLAPTLSGPLTGVNGGASRAEQRRFRDRGVTASPDAPCD